MLTYYVKIIVTLFIVVGSFAFAVPYAVSATNNFIVAFGFLLGAATPLIVWYIWSDEISKAEKFFSDLG